MKAFREGLGLSLREASRQLHVVHPAYKEWEEGRQTPAPAYRDAIEVWTHGEIRASDWPMPSRERDIAEKAARVVPAARGSSPNEPVDPDDTGEHQARVTEDAADIDRKNSAA